MCGPKRDAHKNNVVWDLSGLSNRIRCDRFQMQPVQQVQTRLPRGAITRLVIAASLDIWMVWGKPLEECLHSAQEVITILQELGHTYLVEIHDASRPPHGWGKGAHSLFLSVNGKGWRKLRDISFLATMSQGVCMDEFWTHFHHHSLQSPYSR